jgi:hypothetical protein
MSDSLERTDRKNPVKGCKNSIMYSDVINSNVLKNIDKFPFDFIINIRNYIQVIQLINEYVDFNVALSKLKDNGCIINKLSGKKIDVICINFDEHDSFNRVLLYINNENNKIIDIVMEADIIDIEPYINILEKNEINILSIFDIDNYLKGNN